MLPIKVMADNKKIPHDLKEIEELSIEEECTIATEAKAKI